MTIGADLAPIIRNLRQEIESLPPGAMKDQYQAAFLRMAERMRDLPQRVADRAPFATSADAMAALVAEFEHVIAALELN